MQVLLPVALLLLLCRVVLPRLPCVVVMLLGLALVFAHQDRAYAVDVGHPWERLAGSGSGAFKDSLQRPAAESPGKWRGVSLGGI